MNELTKEQTNKGTNKWNYRPYLKKPVDATIIKFLTFAVVGFWDSLNPNKEKDTETKQHLLDLLHRKLKIF